jgi:hypothetical protein
MGAPHETKKSMICARKSSILEQLKYVKMPSLVLLNILNGSPGFGAPLNEQ